MKHARYLSILMIALLMLLSLYPAMAEEAEIPKFIGDFTEESNVELIRLEEDDLADIERMGAVITEPFIPDGMEKAIIGGDTRITIDNPNTYPYNAIAYLELRYACGAESEASGFMVGPSGMMTAGHCVVCPADGCSLQNMTAYFGFRNGKNYSYKYDGRFTYWYITSYKYDRDSNWDFAYMKLDKRVGDTTGWLGVAAWDDATLSYIKVQVAGYRDRVLKTDWDFAWLYNDYLLEYQNDTVPGNSGCPVIDDDGYAIAIHIENRGQYNYGRRIDVDLFYAIQDEGLFE